MIEDNISRICPYGYRISINHREQIGEWVILNLHFLHPTSPTNPTFDAEIHFPIIENNRFTMSGTKRAVVPAIVQGEHGKLAARSPTTTMCGILQSSMELAMSDMVFNGGPPPTGDVIDTYFHSLIAKDNQCITIPEDVVDPSYISEAVRIHLPEGNAVDNTWRLFRPEDWGILDPNSTPQSEHINRIFRRVRCNHSLCKVIGDNAIGLKYASNRVFLLRTPFERHLRMVDNKQPLVANEKNSLSGMDVTTAIMDLGVSTFEDAIAVSESCANRFVAKRELTQTFTSFHPMEILVSSGSVVSPGDILAKSSDGIIVKANKIRNIANVVSIDVVLTKSYGEPAWRYYFKFETKLILRTGDKLAGRHGNKGVAMVVPDKDMPYIEEKLPDGLTKSNPVDICISPISIGKRKMASLLWEMMANKEALQTGKKLLADAWEVPDELCFATLVQKGHGKKQRLSINGLPLPMETFVGPLFMLRLDKLASEQASAQFGNLVTNHMGLPIDATINGQRRDPSKSIAMYHRRFHGILKSMTLNNLGVIPKFENLVRILEPTFSFKTWGKQDA